MSASAPGTQPEGIRDEREAASYVRRMFVRIAPRYDLLNHLLSFNLDKVWRRRTAQRFSHILRRADARVLDLCCGTGDLTFALQDVMQKGRPGARFFGADFAHPMLTRAAQKAAKRPAAHLAAHFGEADALQLPFADSSFDLVTSAFGFRNLTNYEAGLREIVRVLRPGGEVGILEFSAPRRSIFSALYRFYFSHVLPRVGGAVTGSASAYSYLPASVRSFPAPEDLARMMTGAGLGEIRFDQWMFGSVTLHAGRKP